jgi:hypothetical protein
VRKVVNGGIFFLGREKGYEDGGEGTNMVVEEAVKTS